MRALILASAMLSVFGGMLRAEAADSTNAPVREITLAEAIQLAVRHNLDIQIERYNPRIARLNLDLAYAGWEPTFSGTYQHSFASQPGGPVVLPGGIVLPNTTRESDVDTWSTGVTGLTPLGLAYDVGSDIFRRDQIGVSSGLDYTGSATMSLRQPLLRNLWIDNVRYQIYLGRKSLRISEEILKFRVMSVVNQVQQAYYDLIFARENVVVQKAALDLAERLLAENRLRVEAGQMAPLEEKQSQSQASIRKADLIRAQSQLTQQENLVKKLITDDFTQWMNVNLLPAEKLAADPRPLNLESSITLALSQRPDLKQLRIDVERREITRKYANNQRFPQVDAIGSYGYNALDGTFPGTIRDFRDGDNPTWAAGVSVSVPLGNRAATARYRISKDEKNQAELQVRKSQLDIQTQVKDAISIARSSLEEVVATQDARIYAEQALQAEQKKLENGKSTSFVVLQLQNELTSARFNELRAKADYNKALANLSFAEGSTLEQNRIDVLMPAEK